MPKSGNFSPAFLGSLTPATTVLHEDYTDAVKLALEVYEKFKKMNKSFDENN